VISLPEGLAGLAHQTSGRIHQAVRDLLHLPGMAACTEIRFIAQITGAGNHVLVGLGQSLSLSIAAMTDRASRVGEWMHGREILALIVMTGQAGRGQPGHRQGILTNQRQTDHPAPVKSQDPSHL
jgi:hypothetical protein